MLFHVLFTVHQIQFYSDFLMTLLSIFYYCTSGSISTQVVVCRATCTSTRVEQLIDCFTHGKDRRCRYTWTRPVQMGYHGIGISRWMVKVKRQRKKAVRSGIARNNRNMKTVTRNRQSPRQCKPMTIMANSVFQ